MTDSLGMWSLQVCSIAVLAAVWDMLFPDLKKYGVYSLMRLIMLLCVIRLFLPVLDVTGIEDLFINDEDLSEISAQEVYVSEFSNALSIELLENITDMGIKAQDVRIEISVTEEGYSLDAINLIPADNADLTADSAMLTEKWGIPVYAFKTEGGT